MDNREYHRDYYKKRRAAIVEYLGGHCAVCGSTEKLEVDHKDKAKKAFNISDNLTVNNIQVKTELDKCQLLCEKHHKEKTSKENSGFTHGTRYAWLKKKCRCDICLPAWRKWNDERNIKRRSSNNKRGPYNLPAEHGTSKRYKRGCRCDECRAANTKHVQDWIAKSK